MDHEFLQEMKAKPLTERIEMLNALWEGLLQGGYEPELTEPQKSQINQRLEAYRKFLETAQSWEQIRKEPPQNRAG